MAHSDCPIYQTQHKFQEAEYFLARCANSYHFPLEFQFNLNAFIQAFRNITFMLQSEKTKPDGFDKWYERKREEMRGIDSLRNFVEARNIIVKQSSLTPKSKAWLGLFRGYRMKLAINQELPLFTNTSEALELAKNFAIGQFLDEEHSAIGEQIGVERTWVVEELGPDEVLGICIQALNYMGELIAEVHQLFGIDSHHEISKLDMKAVQILLETDLDPSLPKEWGWE